MGGRKLRLGVYRKNSERKKQKQKAIGRQLQEPAQEEEEKQQDTEDLKVSFPLHAYYNGTVDNISMLASRLVQSHLPAPWIVAQEEPLILSKLQMLEARATVQFSIHIKSDFSWVVTFGRDPVTSAMSNTDIPDTLTSVSSVLMLLSTLNKMRFCPGNEEAALVDLWKTRSITLHGLSCKLL